MTPNLTRRDLIKWLGLSAGATFLASCGGAAPAPTATSAPKPAATTAPAAPAPTTAAAVTPAAKPKDVTLRVWAWTKGEVDEAIELFKKDNPSIKVEYEIFSPQDSFENKLEAAYAAGTPPDVHRMNDDSIPYYGKRGILLPLEDFLPKAINKDEVYWDAVERCNTYGHVQALPIAIRTGCIYYNVDMFKKAGVALPPKKYPDDSWTWDKFVETAKALTKGDEWGFAGADNYDWMFDNLKANGAKIIDDKCTKFMLTEPAAYEAMQYWADMMNVQKAAATPPVVAAMGGNSQMFGAGKTGMVAGSSIPLSGKLPFAWDIGPRPIAPGKKPVTFLAIQTWAAPKATKFPDEAVKLLAYFLSEKAQKTFAATGAVIPLNKKVAADDYQKAFPNANMQMPLMHIPYGQTMPMVVAMKDVKDLTRPQIQVIALGQKKAKDAMVEVEQKCNEAIAKAGGC